MNSELLEALNVLEKEKNISKDTLLEHSLLRLSPVVIIRNKKLSLTTY